MPLFKPVLAENGQMSAAEDGEVVDSRYVGQSTDTGNTIRLGIDGGLFVPAGTKGDTGDAGDPGQRGQYGPAGPAGEATYNGLGSVMLVYMESETADFPHRGDFISPVGAPAGSTYTISNVGKVDSTSVIICATRTA